MSKDSSASPNRLIFNSTSELAQPKSDHRPETPPNMPNQSHVFVSEKIIELSKPKKTAKGNAKYCVLTLTCHKGFIGQRESSVTNVPRAALKIMPSNHSAKLAS